jgi:hypothetical protein
MWRIKMKKSSVLMSALVCMVILVPLVYAKAQKMTIYDNAGTWLDGNENPHGFVVLNQNANNMLIIEVSVKKLTIYSTYSIEFVYTSDPMGGLTPGGGHFGMIYVLGTLDTNEVGNGNAHFVVDPTTFGISGTMYGHVDCEGPEGINEVAAGPFSWFKP